ncbi:MAG: PAS domain-containing protein, partial [Terriglobia bacterium]
MAQAVESMRASAGVAAMDALTAENAAPKELMAIETSTIGLVKSDLDRKITYANPEALRLFGTDSYDGMTLDSYIADAESHEKLNSQLEWRRKGMVGNYRINVKRASDGTIIPVEVTAVPIKNADEEVVGSLGMFVSLERQQLIDDIYSLNRSGKNGDDLLEAVAERVRRSIPFEVMTVTRYSDDLKHANVFLICGLSSSGTRKRRRWIQLDEKQVAWVDAEPAVKRIPNMDGLLDTELFESMKDEPVVQELRAKGCKGVLLRAVHEQNGDGKDKLRGVISFLSPREDAFSEYHAEIV